MTGCYVVVLILLAVCREGHSSLNDNVLRFVNKDGVERTKNAGHSEDSYKPLNHLDGKRYTDCYQVRKRGGYDVSGVYTLHINESFSYQVHCEHTANNSFTVIQRRMNGDIHFKRGFNEYLYGFGNAQGDYWAGLNQIYYLTYTGQNVLTITMQAWNGVTQTVRYSLFRLLDTTYFRLSIGGYSGSIPDDLAFNNGMPFATYDRPDQYNCASNIHAGWWYNYCTYALPNGVYYYGGPYTPPASYYDGIYWKDWVHCEHTANNSFTVIQRRMNGDIHFKRGFNEYLYGFGNAQGDYWAGLNQIYYLTYTGQNVLTITMQAWNGVTQTVRYSLFRLLDTTYFRLSIGGYSGSIPDDLAFNNGMPFATYDRPDQYNCASNIHAGWWYNYCTYALPNGVYYYGGPYTPPASYYDGIYWKDWAGYAFSLKFFSMSLSHY